MVRLFFGSTDDVILKDGDGARVPSAEAGVKGIEDAEDELLRAGRVS